MLTSHSARLTVAAVLAAGLLLAAACGDDGDQETTSSTPVGTPSTSYTVVTTDNEFSITSMTIPANEPVTVEVTNEGAAIHNWHVLDVTSTQGEEIKVPLLQSGESETVTFTISTPGTYDFQCDTHPVEMQGTIVVT